VHELCWLAAPFASCWLDELLAFRKEWRWGVIFDPRFESPAIFLGEVE